jgi:hypothetical protein
MDTRDIKLYGVAGKRIRQADITPTALKKQLLGQLASFTNTATGTVVMGNGDEVAFEVTVTNDLGFDMLAVEPYVALYIGTVSAANQLPNGSGIDESQWQVVGPFFDFQRVVQDHAQSAFNVYVRNISAGSVTVIFKTATKFLSRTETT